MFGSRVPDSFSFKQAVGQAIIDRIRERTTSNLDRKGKRFKNYKEPTKANPEPYSESIQFRAAGKSVNDPNLTLTGDMLAFMDIVSTDRSTITIGFADRLEQKKAHGHILGSKPGPAVKRDFFGLPKDEYKDIARGFNLPDPEPSSLELLDTVRLLTLAEIFNDGAV